MNCPNCESAVDVDEDEVEEGDVVSCDECGAELRVASTAPLELELAGDDEDDEDEDEDFDEDEDEDAEDEEVEEEEAEGDEWS